MGYIIVGGICLFIGILVGVLVMALCAISKCESFEEQEEGKE